METVNNPRLRDRYLQERRILQHFSTCVPSFLLLHYLPTYLFIVLGNFVGCNVPRLFRYSEP